MEISALDVDAVERTATFERLWRAGGLRFWYNNFSDLLTDERANRFAYDFWRDRVRARIADPDRKSVVSGKSVSVRVDLGGRRIIKKTKKNKQNQEQNKHTT